MTNKTFEPPLNIKKKKNHVLIRVAWLNKTIDKSEWLC